MDAAADIDDSRRNKEARVRVSRSGFILAVALTLSATVLGATPANAASGAFWSD
jgi:hypothetical protein